MGKASGRSRRKSPADRIRDFARDFRRGISAAAFVIWCELLRQELGCLKPGQARLEAFDAVADLLTDYFTSLPHSATDKESIACKIDQLADTVENALRP